MNETMPVREEPVALYKYMRANAEEQLSWVCAAIRDCALWFARPSTLNDPSDCAPYVIPPTDNDINAYLQKLVNRKLPDADSLTRNRRMEDERRKLKRRGEPQRRFRALIDEYGICSLSTDSRSIHFWTHYAAGFNGVCLGFTTEYQNDEPVTTPLPVRYETGRPRIHPFRLGEVPFEEGVGRCFLSKDPAHRVEKEWRLLMGPAEGGGDRLYPFAPQCLVQVFIGGSLDLGPQRRILQAISDSKAEPEVLVMSIHPEGRELVNSPPPRRET
jgi:hypothetical protein